MINPHPPLAAFPLVLVVLAVLAEGLTIRSEDAFYRRAARVLLWCTCIISPMTYYAGYWGAELANATFTVSEEVIAAHQGTAQLFLFSLIPCVVFQLVRQGSDTALLRGLYRCFLLLSLALAVRTSAQGGSLVFSHGAGVSAPLPQAAPSEDPR